MSQKDNINEVHGLSTNTSQFGVFYPVEGFLQGGYDTYDEAKTDAVNYEAMDSYSYKDAYVVLVTIARADG